MTIPLRIDGVEMSTPMRILSRLRLPRMRRPRLRRCCGPQILANDRGSTTVTAAFMIAAIVAMTVVSAASAVGLVHRHQAAVAADLTALAAAIAAEQGHDPCARAAEIAAENAADVRQCRTQVQGTEDVIVVVVKHGKEATARAGPL